MKVHTSGPQSGFSLTELLIVLVLISILTTLALMQLGKSRVDFQRQRISREFKIYLERARFDSVKRRAEGADVAMVTLNGPVSFTARLDFDGDGILRPDETRTVNFGDRTDAIIQVSDTLSYPVTLTFNWRGLVTAQDSTGAEVTPLFTICSDCSEASPDITRISVSSSGTVAELRGGQDPQDLPLPDGADGTFTMPSMNCYVLAANTNSSSCIRQ